MERLKVLNDFAFLKAMGEKGDEPQLTAFLNAVLRRTHKNTIASLEFIGNKDLPAEIVGGKSSKLDVLARLADGTRVNIEVQLKNEKNIEKRSLYYWSQIYVRDVVIGENYGALTPVIAINIINFGYIPIDDYHTSFHLWEDLHKDVQLTDVCEIHFLDMTKFRKTGDKKPATDPLHRWLIYFDENSPPELIEEILKMDAAIQLVQDKMEMIRRDPAMLRTYQQYEKAERDVASLVYDAKQEGREEGAIAVARNALAKGSSLEFVADITGLPINVIQQLLHNNL